MVSNNDQSFTRQMRAATKESHDISDALVNAKMVLGKERFTPSHLQGMPNFTLILALNDNRVWADGLLIFYEVFAYLERNVPPEILPEDYHRKEAFEKDLAHFLGPDWTNDYSPRKAVQDYIDHLEELKKENPELLIAYVYHLYMGLLSGAQILQKKRSIAQRLNPLSSKNNKTIGAEATHFENHTASDLKKRMRELVNERAKGYSEETKKRVIEESLKVFELNNKIISTVRGVNQVAFKKVMIAGLFCLLSFLVYKMLFL